MKKCAKCGGEMWCDMCFSCESQKLICNQCNHENTINSENPIEKRNLDEQITIEQPKFENGVVLHCESCGADSHFEAEYISQKCSYCGSNLIHQVTNILHQPDNIVPFEISKKSSQQFF